MTVKNGKVYIGRVVRNLNPAFPTESIALLLVRSGFRDKDTKQLKLTTDYEDTHAKIREAAKVAYKAAVSRALEKVHSGSRASIEAILKEVSVAGKMRPSGVEQFEIVLPVAEIQSVNFFDPRIFDQYFKDEAA